MISPAPRSEAPSAPRPGTRGAARRRRVAGTRRTPLTRSTIAAVPALSAQASAIAMPTINNSPKPRTIGTGESSRATNPAAVASAAVAIVGAAAIVALATRSAGPSPAWTPSVSCARAWNCTA